MKIQKLSAQQFCREVWSGDAMTMTIRGICPHGKVRFMAVDKPEYVDAELKREIGAMVAAGFTIDRVTVEEARKSDMKCPRCDEVRKARREKARA